MQVLKATLAANGASVPHDPADPVQVAYWQEAAAAAGIAIERYPAFFDRIRNGRRSTTTQAVNLAASAPAANTGAFGDGQYVEYVSSLAGSGIASARATLTRTRPIAQAVFSLSILNVTDGTTTSIASTSTMTFGSQTIQLSTNNLTALTLPATGVNYATMSWSIAFADGGMDQASSMSVWAFRASKDPTISAPLIRPDRKTGDLNHVMIGLGRGLSVLEGQAAATADVDYWFFQNNPNDTRMLVPLVGRMFFEHPIAPFNASNPTLDFRLAKSEGGVALAPDPRKYLPGFSIDLATDPEGRVVKFDLKAAADGSGNAIDFGKTVWDSDTVCFFTAMVTVAFKNPQFGSGWSTVLCSLKPDTNPTDGVLYTKPLVYVWHCLAKGTQIAVPGGSKAIESFQAGDLVTSGTGGGTMAVQATLAAPSYSTLLVITTAKGLSVTCSGTHPFLVPGGKAVQARSLSNGSTVLTANGEDTVTSVTPQEGTGELLCNLWLAGEAGTATFQANGFIVGDYQTQVTLVRTIDPDRIRAALPEGLYADFESWLQDRGIRRGAPVGTDHA